MEVRSHLKCASATKFHGSRLNRDPVENRAARRRLCQDSSRNYQSTYAKITADKVIAVTVTMNSRGVQSRGRKRIGLMLLSYFILSCHHESLGTASRPNFKPLRSYGCLGIFDGPLKWDLGTKC